MIHRETVDFGGRPFSIEVGRVAKQAGGAAWVEYGDSRVLVTAVGAKTGRDVDFFPLTVDYQEKLFAVGRFPGGFIKREARPQQREVLTSRMIDRPLRPLFPDNYRNETQVIATVFSADMQNETDIMGMIGASAAVHISDIPWDGPIAGVRVVLQDGEYLCNPDPATLANPRLDVFVASSEKAIVMMEGEADEATEEEMVEALMKAFEWAQPVIQLQNKLREVVGKEKRVMPEPYRNDEVKAKVEELALEGIKNAYEIHAKLERYAAIDAVKEEVKEKLADLPEEDLPLVSHYLSELKASYVRGMIINEKRRIGGRAYDEIRDITVETGLLPRVHGSALFTRGETQSLATVTLGTSSDAQRVDDMLGDRQKPFLLHYNFPPYSVGECKRIGSPGRREIGHGNLADRALEKMVPIGDINFPYSVRIVSEILESNGSSSMATVCGGCVAMMDAGVPIKKPVAGIAMGLIEEGDKIAVLSDILGDEDHLGDMDFKVTGTKDGITAMQMDLKMSGITREILTKALDQAKAGRLHILGKMLEHLPESRDHYSAYAPRIETLQINPDRIRDVIGSGGKTIREIVEQTGCQINVEDDGKVLIASANQENCEMAIEIIKGLTEEPEIGKVYTGKVKRLADFGAFVEIIPGIDGLLHISEVDYKRVEKMEDVMAVGDVIEVKLIDMDRSGKMRLSKRALMPKPEGWEDRPPRSNDRGGDRGPRRDNNRRGGGGGNRRR